MIIKRSIFNNLVDQISRKEVSILLGARQVGKTFLMQEVKKFCHEQGYPTRYLNLELPTDLQELTGTEIEVYRKLTSQTGILFIDEFHYLKNASKIFKAIHDSHKKIKIFASGSSSIEMHKHLKESLAGRLWRNRIYPLTMSERQQDPLFHSESFYQFGGLPGLIHEKEDDKKIKMLEMIVETYITKDIKSLLKEENIRAFNHMISFLSQHQGSIVTSSSLSQEIGLSEPTVSHHLEILSQTYICYALHSFAQNLSNELRKSKKYYLYDLGIRNLFLKDFRPLNERPDIGVIGETFIFHNIMSQLKANMEIRFWRTRSGHEVDFILLKNRIPYPIEVKTTLGKPRITDGMRIFMDAYAQVKEGIIFCRDIEDELIYKNRKIHILPWEKSERISFMESA